MAARTRKAQKLEASAVSDPKDSKRSRREREIEHHYLNQLTKPDRLQRGVCEQANKWQ